MFLEDLQYKTDVEKILTLQYANIQIVFPFFPQEKEAGRT